MPGEWIIGHGWNQNLWGTGFGTSRELDTAALDNPVFLTDMSLHTAWVNSKAMELAGINGSSAEPAGGFIQKDAQGQPTGILFEKAVDLVQGIIPPITAEQRKANLLAAQSRLLGYGITSVHDFDRAPCFTTLQELEQENRLLLRVFKSLPVEQLAEAVKLGLHTGFGSQHLRIGPVKLFADGALGPQTAAMRAPYEGSDFNSGKLLLSAAEILETGRLASKCGLSLAVHAIGDLATQEVLDAFSQLRLFEQENRLPALKHRIEHLQLLSPENIELTAKLNIWASMQPVHLYADRRTADRYWGARSRYAFAFATLLDQKTRLIFGSDAPVENPNPFWGIHAAVTRESQVLSPGELSWYPAELISLTDALKAYTIDPARQAGMEELTGSIQPGKMADLVVLDQDPFLVEPEALYTIHPYRVMVDGGWVDQAR